MTQQQQTALDRAIERAGERGITVLASGRIKTTGKRFYLVKSESHPERPHIVWLHRETNRLSCDCRAGQAGAICVHKASCHMHLRVQAWRRQMLDEAVEKALREEAEERARLERVELADRDRWALVESGNW